MALPDPSQTGDDFESEWEYEYDDHETEDLYFTLDLTTHVPDALVKNKQDDINRQNANTTTDQSQNDLSSPERGASSSSPDDRLGSHEIQILDLHTSNPLVRLDDALYSCYWSTDLGTQFHIAKAGAVENPRRAGDVLDVIGISQARLIGRPVSLQAREDVGQMASAVATPDHVIDSDHSSDDDMDADDESNEPTQPEPNILSAPGEPLAIPRDLCKDSAGEDEAAFLERLSAIKVRKGEYDPIAVYSVKQYNGPSAAEQDAIRKQALEEDAEMARQAKAAKEASVGETPKKRRKRWTNPEADDDNTIAPLASKRIARSGRLRNEELLANLGYQVQPNSQGAAPPDG